ncbi:MAG: hypothetical protein AB1777_09905 [Bacteroidota bacterium]
MKINKSNNNNSSKKVIIIEFYNYHSECIYPQVIYLTKSGYEVEVICSNSTMVNIEYLNKICNIKAYNFSKTTSYLKLWLYLLKVRKTTSAIILNTAQGSKVLKFILLPFLKGINFFGIIHNLKKIEKSKGQKFISRKISKYIVIAEYLKDTEIGKMYQIPSINTSLFPNFELDETIEKGNDIWIAIPGNIEIKRRDYIWLIDLCHTNRLNNLKFILLGNSKKGDGLAIIRRIKDLNLENYFVWFDSFIKQETFNTYIQKADYLLPLLNPNSNEYLKYKISGIFNLSEAFNKPMILHSNFKLLEKYYCCLFYNNIDEFKSLISTKPNIECKSVDFEKNRIKYLEAIQLL